MQNQLHNIKKVNEETNPNEELTKTFRPRLDDAELEAYMEAAWASMS